MEEFNVDWKAKCGKLNLAHLTKNKNMKKKLKQTNTSAHLVRSKSKIDRVSSLKRTRKTTEEEFVKYISFKSGV